jgi:hypothetical protein
MYSYCFGFSYPLLDMVNVPVPVPMLILLFDVGMRCELLLLLENWPTALELQCLSQ